MRSAEKHPLTARTKDLILWSLNLYVACGIGIVSLELHDLLDHATETKLDLTCLELSQPLVEYMERKVAALSWNAEVVHPNAEV